MTATPALSLIVVCHEMVRELPRTLLSLSPSYQRGVAPEDCEIIVVDNGSRRPPRREDFTALHDGVEFSSCSRPNPSPVLAINEGLARARGAIVGIWIDGARMASPGLVRSCLEAARLHPRPVIATLNYQIGPARQLISAEDGYNQAVEDGLLAGIGWPADGYRLFDISTLEMAAPDAPMLESNALFMPRALWDALGGYDEAFSAPGGGLVNPDTLVRAVGLSGAQLIRIVGEGTFHQIHGGLTTSSRAKALEYVKVASREYHALRGRPMAPVRDVGWLFQSPDGRCSLPAREGRAQVASVRSKASNEPSAIM